MTIKVAIYPNCFGIKAEMDKKGLNERLQKQEADWRKERDQLIGRATDLEVEIKVTSVVNKSCTRD